MTYFRKLLDSEKEQYKLITVEELESKSMPDSTLVDKDAYYKYFVCGGIKVKIERD